VCKGCAQPVDEPRYLCTGTGVHGQARSGAEGVLEMRAAECNKRVAMAVLREATLNETAWRIFRDMFAAATRRTMQRERSVLDSV
jgi:hypothetical protein